MGPGIKKAQIFLSKKMFRITIIDKSGKSYQVWQESICGQTFEDLIFIEISVRMARK